MINGYGPFSREMLSVCHQASFAIHNLLMPICKGNQITPQQLFIMGELVRNPQQPVSDLCHHAGIAKTNFALVCKKLEARGLVRRVPSQIDRRSYSLCLTDEGRCLLLQVNEEIHQQVDPVFDSVSDQVLEDLIKGFQAMEQILACLPEGMKDSPRKGMLSRRASGRMYEVATCSDASDEDDSFCGCLRLRR